MVNLVAHISCGNRGAVSELMLNCHVPLLVNSGLQIRIGQVKRGGGQTVSRKGQKTDDRARRARKSRIALVQGKGRQGQPGVVRLTIHYKRGIDDSQVVYAVTFHVGGNSVCGANHRIGHKPRLPRQTKARLEISTAIVGVVIRTDLRRAAEPVKIDVVRLIRIAARRGDLVTKTEVQSEVAGDTPVILHEGGEQAVAQVKIKRSSQGDVARQTQEKIRKSVPRDRPRSAIPSVLSTEGKRPRHSFVARIDVVNVVMKEFRAKMNRMVAVSPRERVLRLDCGVVEYLDAIRATQAGERATVTTGSVKGETRQDRAGNAGDAKTCRQVDARRVCKNLIVHWKILEADAEIVQERGRKGMGVIQHEILQGIFPGEVRQQGDAVGGVVDHVLL